MSEATFSIVATLPAPRTVGARWWALIVRFFTAEAVQDTTETPVASPRPQRRQAFMEDAAMRREMYRL